MNCKAGLVQSFKRRSERAYRSYESRANLPREVFDAGAGDDTGAVAEEVWLQDRVKGGS
jgi:hypothetical protein